jgi:Beta-lactamase
MRRKSPLGLPLLAALLLFVLGSFAARAGEVVCDDRACLDLDLLKKSLVSGLKDKVEGYVVIVGGLAPAFGGLAQTATDAPPNGVAMTPQRLSNVASLSKVLTTVALLQALERRNLTIDQKIAPFLFPDWAKGPNVDEITFADLVTHRSGFRGALASADPHYPDCGSTLYSNLKAQIAFGVEPADRQVPLYCNSNIGLIRELLPQLEGRTDIAAERDESKRAKKSSQFYIDYMNAHVFRRVLGASRACKRTSRSDYALAYSFPADSTPGHEWSDGTLICGASNWVLSARDLHRLLGAIGRGGKLLSDAARTTMSCQRLSWDNWVRPADCPEGNLCKHGAVGYFPSPDAPYQAVRTYAGLFACDTPVVLFANSPLPSTPDDALTFVRDALKRATLDRAPKGARHCAKTQFTLSTNCVTLAAGQSSLRIGAEASATRWPDPSAIRVTVSGLPQGVSAKWIETQPFARQIRGMAGVIEFSASPAAPSEHALARVTATSGAASYAASVDVTVGGSCQAGAGCGNPCGLAAPGCGETPACDGCPSGEKCSETTHLCLPAQP